MRWVVALLLFANVALYLWVGDRTGDDAQGLSAEPEVNREGMLLLHEIRQGNQATAAPATKPSPGKLAPDARADLSCYRIGPFKKKPTGRPRTAGCAPGNSTIKRCAAKVGRCARSGFISAHLTRGPPPAR